MEQIAGGIHWPTHTGLPRVPVRLQSLVSIAINQRLTTMENQIQQQWSFHPEKIAESSWRGCSKLVKQSRNHAEHPHSQHGSAGLTVPNSQRDTHSPSVQRSVSWVNWQHIFGEHDLWWFRSDFTSWSLWMGQTYLSLWMGQTYLSYLCKNNTVKQPEGKSR